ncbi:ubiquitin-conjugating enzyme E2 [Catovirus CTV1]|uniref:Ubiquitin-conjugating enzyme E2 n=1 Tax=Catovirus CTV1 TaxID=1977631 RepID=A0A1V0SAU8_9VIRU|nr:ubiquitin-conjugating enzyme E2 [Catovirus CTV1]
MIPRNIQLIDELEESMKGKYGEVSFGVLDNDITLTNWQGSIITNKGDIIEFTFVCEMNYPMTPPKITFNINNQNNYITKICLNDGTLKNDVKEKLDWKSNHTIGEYLTRIKRMIDN